VRHAGTCPIARGPAGALAALLCLLAAASLPSPARAGNDLGLFVDPVEIAAGAVTVSYRVERPFTPRLEETLLQGMPATVTIEVGLWKRRPFWFDKLVVALKNEHKVAFDPWRKEFRIRAGGIDARTRSVPSLDSLRSALFLVRRLPVSLLTALEPDASYYVTVRALIRPVSEEDLGEIEDWLAGEVRDPEGTSRGLPRYLFGITANLAGLGSRTALEKSERFTPARLVAAAPGVNP
jgi:hypothetical protein